MKISELKTVDVNTLEWFDRVNGNTYFASEIILNYGLKNQVNLKNKYQYGYGDSGIYEAWHTIFKHFDLDNNVFSRSFPEDNNIITRYTKRKALKRELKNI